MFSVFVPGGETKKMAKGLGGVRHATAEAAPPHNHNHAQRHHRTRPPTAPPWAAEAQDVAPAPGHQQHRDTAKAKRAARPRPRPRRNQGRLPRTATRPAKGSRGSRGIPGPPIAAPPCPEAGAPTPGSFGISYGSGTQGTEVRGPGPDSALNVGHARDHTASGHLVASGRFRALGIRLLRVAHAGIASYGLR